MGFVMNNFSLDELNKISVPGKVSPALFWALPIGRWYQPNIEEWWKYFNEGNNTCTEVGLILINDAWPLSGKMTCSDSKKTDVNLKSVGAKLREIMPQGTDRFVAESVWRDEDPKLLVFSGAYPHPGWGVLCDIDQNQNEIFGQIIENVVNSLRLSMGADIRNVECAREKHWEFIEAERRKPHLLPNANLQPKIEQFETVRNSLNELLNYLQAGHDDLPKNILNDTLAKIKNISPEYFPNDLIGRFVMSSEILFNANKILAVGAEDIHELVENHLKKILSHPESSQQIYKAITNNHLKNALSACVTLIRNGVIKIDDIHAFTAAKLCDTHKPSLKQDVETLLEFVRNELIRLSGTQQLQNMDFKREEQTWKKQIATLRTENHQARIAAISSQWNLGPRFLVDFADACTDRRIKTQCISWDPARMIGWKLFLSEIKITLRDLHEIAQSTLNEDDLHLSNEGETLVDGSYFTDYVHYISMSSNGSTPWKIAREIVQKLLRISDMIRLLPYPISIPENGSREQYAGALLDYWGWNQIEGRTETPLAACLKTDKMGGVIVAPNLEPIELRTIIESFCKDLLDTITAQLHYDDNQIWDVVKEQCPTYKSSTFFKNWRTEVEKITLGPAILLIKSLGELAFPNQRRLVDELIVLFENLAGPLNKACHDNDGDLLEWKKPELIVNILKCGNSLVGELPWHLKPDHEFGDQPRIVTGQAWSHGYPTPRLIRVVTVGGHKSKREMFVWNRSGRNPVISDPVFLRN